MEPKRKKDVDIDEATRAAVLAELEAKSPAPAPPAAHVQASPAAAPAAQVPVMAAAAPSSGDFLGAVAFLRFPAAIMIVIGHMAGLFGIPKAPWQLAHAVSFFVILSGFCLAWRYPELPRDRVGDFLRARLARILPLYLLSMVLILLVDPIIREGTPGVAYLSNLLLVHHWVEFAGKEDFNHDINTAAWTISTLFALYLIFPLIIHRWEQTWRLKLIGAAVLALVMVWAAGHTFMSEASFIYKVDGHDYPVNKWLYRHFVPRLFEFTLGIAAAMLLRKRRQQFQLRAMPALALEVAAIVLAVLASAVLTKLVGLAVLLTTGSKPLTMWIIMGTVPAPFFAALIVIMAIKQGPISRLLATPLPVFLGQISAAVYLLHLLVVRYYRVHEKSFPSLPAWMLFALSLLFIVLLATTAYLAVERPARAFLSGRGKSADPSPRIPTPTWLLPTLGVAVLAATLGWRAMGHYQPAIRPVDSAAATQNVDQMNVAFHIQDVEEPLFILRGMKIIKMRDALRVRLVWESKQTQKLDFMVQVHLIEQVNGKLKFQKTHPQDPRKSTVEAGTVWEDKFDIAREKLVDIKYMAIGLNKTDLMLKADSGERDWEDRRLLISLEKYNKDWK